MSFRAINELRSLYSFCIEIVGRPETSRDFRWHKPVADVTIPDILAITDAVK